MKALQFSVSVPQFAALKVLGSISQRLYYYGPLATVHIVEVPEPALPSSDWVKIRTIYAGESSHINPIKHLVGYVKLVVKTRRSVRNPGG